jgi:arylsulfatase A-like enzyme
MAQSVIVSSVRGTALRRAWLLGWCALAGVPAILLTAAEPSAPVFDGQSLAGWTTLDGKPVTSGWEVVDGTFHLPPRTPAEPRAGHIITARDVGNFDLSFEFKLAAGGNSGLKYRVRPYGKQWLGLEYQIYDDSSARVLSPRKQTGSIYDLYEPTVAGLFKPPGEFNSARIRVRTHRVEHWLNGTKIVSARIGNRDWRTRLSESKFSDVPEFARQRTGRIMLTDHGSEVWYRNFVFRPLPTPEPQTAPERNRESTPAGPPNVLFVAVDDLNDWIGCLGGHPQTATPHIDRLAHRGTLFTNAHCQGPICGPSRAALLSGRYPHTTGVYDQPQGQRLADDQVHFRGHLLPELFAAHGYRTFGVGKITHGYPMEVAFQDAGERFGGSGPKPEKGVRFHYHLPDVPYSGTQTDWGPFPDRDEQMPDHQVADWAIERLRAAHEAPFFLAVGFSRPHVPWYVPQKWFDQIPLEGVELPVIRDDDLSDVPAIGRQIHELPKYPSLDWLRANDNAELRLATQAYLACVRFVDHEIGRVLRALEESPHAGNTIVVLFGDHGYHVGEKGRVSKHGLWEEATRVPLIVVRPGEQDRGHRAAQPVGLIDLSPTLLELCGLPARARDEGRSLVPLLDDTTADWRYAILTTYARGNHALRSTRYRYIRYEDGSEELYDHVEDPQEWVNLADRPEHAELLATFRRELPTSNAPYHPAVNLEPINAWFEAHFRSQSTATP